ncbi:MAG TPA: hypothetical protein VF263_08170, partial [Longimicrobiaceae bacterium]
TEGTGQMQLFEAPLAETERDRSLSRAADAIRARFGEGALRPGRIVEGGETRGGRRARKAGSEE